MKPRGVRIAVLLAAVAVLVAGCGGDDDPRLVVAGATSLRAPFTEYADGYEGADVRLSFAGSDQLAAQIRSGARPDVYASATEELVAALHREGLVDRPVRFARNRIVVAVPEHSGRVKTFEDLADDGVRIAAGSPAVPVGAYTLNALAQLPPAQRRAIEDNIASEEPDVAAVIGRVRSGAVDAGFVYVTDVSGLTELGSIELPVQLEAVYAAAVVRGSDHPEEARRFIHGLTAGPGRQALERAGFR